MKDCLRSRSTYAVDTSRNTALVARVALLEGIGRRKRATISTDTKADVRGAFDAILSAIRSRGWSLSASIKWKSNVVAAIINGFQKPFSTRTISFIRLARMGECTRINGAINGGSMGTLWPRKRSSDSKNISSRFKSKRRCPSPPWTGLIKFNGIRGGHSSLRLPSFSLVTVSPFAPTEDLMEYRTNEFQRDARDREGREASNYPRRGNSLEEAYGL